MSQEFEKIKNEVTSFRQAAENKIELEKRAVEERIKKEELTLEKSGLRSLFEEIRDSGLVKWRYKTNNELEGRKRFFRSYEENLEYLPAHIETHTVSNIDGIDIASLSLKFNVQNDGSSDATHDEVRVAVVGEELCLGGFRSSGYCWFYTPIKEEELATTIAEAIKNPVRAGGY